MPGMRLRLLGGFAVSIGGRPVAGFESRKLRALLAFLVMREDPAPLSRRHAAALLWPEDEDSVARKHLRQAVYNLRRAMDGGGPPGSASFVQATRTGIMFNRDSSYWLDAEVFAKRLEEGLEGGQCINPRALADAVELYGGDFLSGLGAGGSTEFQQWLLSFQERFRERAIEAVRALSRHFAERGEYGPALTYGSRQLEFDPLSEEAHRGLIRLYALSGRRSRALAQYESCLNLLRMELGVEPLEETTALYKSILAEEIEMTGAPAAPIQSCPTVPLVGRRPAYTALRRSWERTAAGEGGRIAIVVGEDGVGKSRLAKAFIHDASARGGVRVLISRGQGGTYELPFEAVVDAVRSAISGTGGEAGGDGAGAQACLEDIVGDVAGRYRGMQGDDATRVPRPGAKAARLTDTLITFLDGLAHPGERGCTSSLIWFLEDLDRMDRDSRQTLLALLPRLARRRIWLLATRSSLSNTLDGTLTALLGGKVDPELVDVVFLERLEDDAVGEIAESLVGPAQAPELAEFLIRRSEGLPVAIVEWINLLCDEGYVRNLGEGRWVLESPLQDSAFPGVQTLEGVLERRVSSLPDSVRRLLTLAAIIGPTFDAGFLQRVAGDSATFVEMGIEAAMERWLVRHYPPCWFESRRERDVVLLSRGINRGVFQLAHEPLRRHLSGSVNWFRRQHLHRQVARALEEDAKDGSREVLVALLNQLSASEEWARVCEYCGEVAEAVLGIGSRAAAKAYCEAGLEAGTRAVTGSETEERRVNEALRRLERLRLQLGGVRGRGPREGGQRSTPA